MHGRLGAVQETMMTVMIVMIVMMTTTVYRRSGLVAVLVLGHAQLLRRLRAEFSYRARAIAVRHLLRKQTALPSATATSKEVCRLL